jgi:tRNA-2-methylthio-N6-dimethylallyladenosine synthase
MNERDSEAVAAQLCAKGYTMAPSENQADIVLLNTCSVRDQAEQKALGKMRNLATTLKRERPEAILGFMGCMAQSRGQSLVDELPDVDLVIGTQKFHHAPEYISQLIQGKSRQIVDVDEEEGSEGTIKDHLIKGKSNQIQITAFVSIMQGCNQHCTFCIVPYTRGKERSRSIEDIVHECRRLVEQGVREITLLGQIVNSYGKREIGVKEGKSAFVQLLEAVHAIDGLERIRFTSPHPKGYGDDLIEAYGRLPKLCPSAHLPVQSGSNHVLKRMHRVYTRERFLEIIRKLRGVIPEMGITTDFIVGFPGESEADFDATMDLAQEAAFDNAFVFKYSQRTGTPAATMDGQLAKELIESRHAQLLKKITDIGRGKYEQFLGREVEILVEGPSRKNPERMEGRTGCNKIAVFDGYQQRLRGQKLNLKVERVGTFTLYGDPAINNVSEAAS